ELGPIPLPLAVALVGRRGLRLAAPHRHVFPTVLDISGLGSAPFRLRGTVGGLAGRFALAILVRAAMPSLVAARPLRALLAPRLLAMVGPTERFRLARLALRLDLGVALGFEPGLGLFLHHCLERPGGPIALDLTRHRG